MSRSNNGGLFAGMFGAFGVSMVFVILVNVLIAWVIASAATSGIKALTDNCGTEYRVEAVVSGDWFCPDAPAK